jgi:hypothetical protein
MTSAPSAVAGEIKPCLCQQRPQRQRTDAIGARGEKFTALLQELLFDRMHVGITRRPMPY